MSVVAAYGVVAYLAEASGPGSSSESRLAMLGVIGGPLICVSSIALLFGGYEQDGLQP